MAVIVALMAMLMMSALGAALVLTTSSETTIAANFRNAQEGVYAAEAALELAMRDLRRSRIGRRSRRSCAVGVRRRPAGRCADAGRRLAARSGSPRQHVELPERHRMQCVELIAITPQRPWGANNPVWRLFAYGPLRVSAEAVRPATPSTPLTTSSCCWRTTRRRMTAIRFGTAATRRMPEAASWRARRGVRSARGAPGHRADCGAASARGGAERRTRSVLAPAAVARIGLISLTRPPGSRTIDFEPIRRLPIMRLKARAIVVISVTAGVLWHAGRPLRWQPRDRLPTWPGRSRSGARPSRSRRRS